MIVRRARLENIHEVIAGEPEATSNTYYSKTFAICAPGVSGQPAEHTS